MKKLLIFLCCCICLPLTAQEYFPNNESVRNVNKRAHAFTNARIFITPTTTIDNGTLLIHDGRIIAAGTSVAIPANAEVTDLKGKHIYPSFIDIYTSFGIEKPKAVDRRGGNILYDSKRTGYYWNEHIKAEANAFEEFSYQPSQAEELLKAGFGVVGTHIQDGIARGTGMLVALNNTDPVNRILSDRVSNHLSFSRSVATPQMYPTSLMGSMALIRQMYHDMKWYHAAKPASRDISLEALYKNRSLPQIFTTDDKLNSIRAANLGKEFNINYIIRGGGNEFERIDEIKATKNQYIIPIAFPEAYDMSDPHLGSQVELYDLRNWNQSPTSLKILADNNVVFALTTDKLKKPEDFRTNLQKAIDYGFSRQKALEALTSIPAEMLGMQTQIGSLRPGSYANFLITSGDIFDTTTVIYENWVQGSKFIISDKDIIDLSGEYTLTFDNKNYKWKVTGEPGKPESSVTDEIGNKVHSKMIYKDNWMSLLLKPSDSSSVNFSRLRALVSDVKTLSGNIYLADGRESSWTATRVADVSPAANTKADPRIHELMPITFPNVPFGNLKRPQAETLLFKGATVWTNEKDGILPDTDVLVRDGKIAAIGKGLNVSGAKVIDAKGKHLSSGIIDEHSHIAISRGVNEFGHNSSAEVTIEDVVNPDDINIYRNLAGGVTTAQLLHGSANPIGGRSAIIRMKWGAPASEMLFPNQPGFIKFALGENVKQSNFTIDNPSRYPQTRMGVEQVFTDYFQRAREYEQSWKAYRSNRSKKNAVAPRFDIEMETLTEILNRKRYITCHSYVQSEILMLMDVAEKYGFKVNTFTHILEGYKVADEMKKHGAAASTFSDWWAYKFEVNDAIPYNGALMHRQGLTVAFNSDDAEMSRRLNQEAAKAIKYGGLTEEESWKFVTLNPAKMLHIDHRTGSIKVGKDADLVLWSDNPLSIYARAERTMVEGITYFELTDDQSKRAALKAERSQLITQLLQEKNSGMLTQPPKKTEKSHYHCDTLEH